MIMHNSRSLHVTHTDFRIIGKVSSENVVRSWHPSLYWSFLVTNSLRDVHANLMFYT